MGFGARGRPFLRGGRRYASGLALRSALQPPLAALVWPSATRSAALGRLALRAKAAAPPKPFSSLLDR
ncbi:hypothetical protein SapgrDRAFT_0558 [Saprospira grandis DSM 2844]|uniref:Uncharacterized protein n=1 Tax=Saprospira grandis DSM 2844 TaxID=694433 RepID=J0XTP9_9BACT|nr:hypothetical protein SapgrDRAFT_0558 [Saprospira grandis DSM 2844]